MVVRFYLRAPFKKIYEISLISSSWYHNNSLIDYRVHRSSCGCSWCNSWFLGWIEHKNNQYSKKLNMTNTEIRNHITYLRKTRKVWIKELAKAISKSESSIIRYEKGISHMSEETVTKILSFFYEIYGDTTTIVIGKTVEIETRNTHKSII